MRLRVTCAGVEVGWADFEPAAGVAHAMLDPGPGYPLAAAAAQAMGRMLAVSQYWPATAGDFADAATARWEGDRLALEDALGQELGVAGITLIERWAADAALRDPPLVVIVADFRPDMARVEAFLRTLGSGGGNRHRPAA